LGKADAGKPVKIRKVHPRWITIRKAVQFLLLVTFIYLFLISRQDVPGNDLIGHFMLFDPLLALTSLLSSRSFLALTVIELLLAVILALLAGRVWCGWLCPLGTTLDLVRFNKNYSARIPEEMRTTKYSLLLVILFASLFGNLTLLIFDPLTILYRTLGSSIHPALNQIVTIIETSLYPIPLFQGFISWLEVTLRPAVLPLEPLFFEQALLFGVFFLSILGLNKLAPRFWCRYLCPTGAFLGLISKIAVFRREPEENCRNCALCSRACPTGTIDPEKGYRSDPGECILCLDCFTNCPDSTLAVHSPHTPAIGFDYDPRRRHLVTTAVVSVAGAALFHSQGKFEHPNIRLLRPPGAAEEHILSNCLRCGICVRACPTNIIQPAGTQFGLERLWTPVLEPERGYCEFTCNICGQVCPVDAIPALSLELKQTTVIGKAFIDQNHCLAWSDHKMCMVCEEMCPLPEKAITLTDLDIVDFDGTKRSIRVPQVDRSKCIGCGVCENKCPVIGEAAIRVRIANPDLYF